MFKYDNAKLILMIGRFDRSKEKGAYFEGSDKKYPEIDLPKWMQEQSEEDS